MEGKSFEARNGSQGNDLQTSTVVDTMEASILSAHRSYFHGKARDHGHEEAVLYDCVIKYFNCVP